MLKAILVLLCLCLSSHAGSLDPPLQPAELAKVLDYLIEQLKKEFRTDFDAAEVARATGVPVTEAQQAQILPALMARLQQSEEGRALAEKILLVAESGCAAPCSAHGPGCVAACGTTAAASNRCAEYSACSLYGDLSSASGEMLELYRREKASEGAVADRPALPALPLVDLDGRSITLGAVQGKPMSLLFLAGHCSHSFQTLAQVERLAERAEQQGIELALILVNSGSAEDVGQWIREYAFGLPIYVAADASIGDTIQSHLVPTQLLIGDGERLDRKLVGFKSLGEIERNWDEVFGAASTP